MIYEAVLEDWIEKLQTDVVTPKDLGMGSFSRKRALVLLRQELKVLKEEEQ